MLVVMSSPILSMPTDTEGPASVTQWASLIEQFLVGVWQGALESSSLEKEEETNVRGRERKDIYTLLIHFAHGCSISCLNIFPPRGLAGTSGVKDQVPSVCVLGSNTAPGTEMPKEATLEK